MIFNRLLAKAQSSKPSKSTSMKKKSPKNLFLQENNNLASTNDLNQALAEIEDLAKKEKLSDHLLLRKADILLRKGKIKQSRQILTDLASKIGTGPPIPPCHLVPQAAERTWHPLGFKPERHP